MRPFEYLFLRQMKFDYISPPICEALFSSTGEPTILLETFERDKVQGLELDASGALTLRWSAYPGALCYSVYQADGPEGPWVLVAECVEEFPIPDENSCYLVSAITPDGESDLSDPLCPSTITCPEWITALGGTTSESCGALFSLTVEAATDPVDSIYYEWVKDGSIVFAETKTGASTFVVNSLVEDDAGTYVVNAYYGDECFISTSQVLEVTGCGGGGGCDCLGVMPDSFMEDCDELVATYANDGNFPSPPAESCMVGAGVYEIRYVGGAAYECYHSWTGGSPCESQTCQANSVWSIGSINGSVKADFGLGLTQITSLGASKAESEFRLGGGNDCLKKTSVDEAVIAGLLEVAYPGKKNSASVIPWVWDAGAEKTYPATLDAIFTPSDATCAEVCGSGEDCRSDGFGGWIDCNPAVSTVSVELYRIRKFIAQPTVLTIQGWGAAMKALLIGAINPKANVDVGYEWAGKFGAAPNQVDEYPGIADNGISYSFFATYPYPGIGQIDVSGSSVWASVGNPNPADDKWQLTIFASWLDQADVWQAETLWRGTKLSGTTGEGAYCWEASFVPELATLLPCIVLV